MLLFSCQAKMYPTCSQSVWDHSHWVSQNLQGCIFSHSIPVGFIPKSFKMTKSDLKLFPKPRSNTSPIASHTYACRSHNKWIGNGVRTVWV
jgi:hypothetical protein